MTQSADALIHTTGDGAIGIFAQSIGGTGGLIQRSNGQRTIHTHKTSGNGGDIDIVQNGILQTEGLYADGIYALTHGSEDPGNIDITVNGTVQTSGSDVNAVVAAATAATARKAAVSASVSARAVVFSPREPMAMPSSLTTPRPGYSSWPRFRTLG